MEARQDFLQAALRVSGVDLLRQFRSIRGRVGELRRLVGMLEADTFSPYYAEMYELLDAIAIKCENAHVIELVVDDQLDLELPD
jgi:hypothetical protein